MRFALSSKVNVASAGCFAPHTEHFALTKVWGVVGIVSTLFIPQPLEQVTVLLPGSEQVAFLVIVSFVLCPSALISSGKVSRQSEHLTVFSPAWSQVAGLVMVSSRFS